MNNYSNSTYLNTIIDEFFNNFPTYTTNNSHITTTNGIPNYYSGDNFTIDYFPNYNWNDVVLKYEFKSKPKTFNYPKTSGYFKSDGTMIIEIAVTGFKKDELNLKREGEKIIITGKKDKIGEEGKDRLKMVWQDISKKSFELVYNFDEKMDLDKIDISLEDGILTISVPVQEKHKPVVKELEIK